MRQVIFSCSFVSVSVLPSYHLRALFFNTTKKKKRKKMILVQCNRLFRIHSKTI